LSLERAQGCGGGFARDLGQFRMRHPSGGFRSHL
jgi:hypothetical protein